MAEPRQLFAPSSTSSGTSAALDVGGRVFNTFAIVTTGFSGNIEIQGQHPSEGATWHRVRYWEYNPADLYPTGPFIGNIVPPANGARHYYVVDPWRTLRVVKVQGGGTIGVDYFPQPMDSGFLLLGSGAAASESSTVVQSDASELNAAAHLTVGLEDVGPLNPVPISGDVSISDSLPAGENHLGQVGGYGVTRRVEITRPANTTAYTANDVVKGNNSGLLRIPNAVRVPGGACYLHGVQVIGNQANGGGAETWQPRVWLHQRERTVALADNAPFTGSFDILQQTGFLTEVLLPALAAPAASTIDKAVIENISVLLKADPGSMDILFDLQTLTAFTPASGALYAVQFHLTQL